MSSRRQLRHIATAYPTTGRDVVALPAANKQLQVYKIKAMNNSAGAADVMLMKRMSALNLAFYQYASGSPGVATAVAISGLATSLPTLYTAGANNSGYIVQSSEVFSLIGITIQTAAHSGSTLDIRYWTGAAWAAVSTLAVPVLTTGSGASVVYAFSPPIDWAAGGDPTGLDASKYSIMIRATTADAGAAPTISALWVAQMLDLGMQIAQYGSLVRDYPPDFPLMLSQGEGIQPYFSVAGANSSMAVSYAIQE